MSGRDAALAVLLRKAEWMLDDAAHALGNERLTTTDREALAEALTELAGALREHGHEHHPAPANAAVDAVVEL